MSQYMGDIYNAMQLTPHRNLVNEDHSSRVSNCPHRAILTRARHLDIWSRDLELALSYFFTSMDFRVLTFYGAQVH